MSKIEMYRKWETAMKAVAETEKQPQPEKVLNLGTGIKPKPLPEDKVGVLTVVKK